MPASPVRSGLVPIMVALALVSGCGSSGHAASTVAAPPPASPIGQPTGTPVTKTVGASGGTVSSGDGRITVTIPPGALGGDTPIGIQPIQNTASGGLGAAYRLTPAGQTFSQPVTVSFPYVDTDLEGTSPEALGIAFQDGKGLWEWQTSTTVDTAAKRLSVTTRHFTDWSKVPGMQLKPGDASAKVKQTVNLKAVVCVVRGTGDVVFLRPTCGDPTDDLADLVAVKPGTWAVNGARGGTAATGTVKGGKVSAVYTAPAKKPAGKTIVTVSVEAKVRKGKTLLVSNITIIGGYRVVGQFRQTKSALVCAGTVTALVTDTVAFTLTDQGNFYDLTDIKNTKTAYSGVAVPVISLGVRVTSPPDVFNATKGHADVSGDLVSVAVRGLETIGVCSISGIKTGGALELQGVNMSFYVSKFADGRQVGIPDDRNDMPWTWVVTEQ